MPYSAPRSPGATKSKGVEVDDELSFERSSYCATSCCLEVALVPRTGKVYLRNSRDPGARMEFSTDEWRAFLAGAKSNEFDV
jgi:hypothetical protein